MWSFQADPDEQLALELLDALEAREYELLTWGFLDGGFAREEVEELAEQILSDRSVYDVGAEHLISMLEERKLLFELTIGDRTLWRTRFAEAIRLFARLRQMFKADAWSIAPSLVADFRLAMRPRRYPRRDISPSQVQSALAQAVKPRPLQATEKQVLHALTHDAGGSELRLSKFQVDAAAELLRVGNGKARGTIVCAGTGTGKTISFYLPTLMHIARNMNADNFWVQALAIYPRNELLKDQFTEAYNQARKLDSITLQKHGRKIRIGAFYGDTPNTAGAVHSKWAERTVNGAKVYICPMLRCPICDSDLAWSEADIARNREELHCLKSGCNGGTREDEVILTRSRMQGDSAQVPDILFTSAEMLNRSMSSTWNRHLFGIDVPRERAISFVLLDEVHTYGGTHGAQVALLLRRWKHAAGGAPHFVGLSATLSDPQSFFADLTGLSPGQVMPVSVGDTLEEEGKEYQLVLRGDPVSGTSLLSTSIQAAMLLSRVMEPRGGEAGELWGQRIFAFTDDLDVTNRLFHNTLDAEGRNSKNKPKVGRNGAPAPVPLASLRNSSHPCSAERLAQGQNWLMCEEIGHDLGDAVASPGENARMKVGRTSSQDAGVDAGSQIIVATASLEVGFNDPTVGAVMQHKAPRDPASFLQRKGRAGRRRITRPWTVVVLSDYGRDRLTYQNYDQLFDPVLEKPSLPIDNRYVLRIQATFAFMDWMTQKLKGTPQWRGSVWDVFSRPARPDNAFDENRQQKQAEIIRQVLDGGALRADLFGFLGASLQISPDDVRAVMWEPPRSLMTAVLPTLWRRLTYRWRVLGEGEGRDMMAQHAPLPEFVTANLFSDLNTPEVLVLAPRTSFGNQPPRDPYEQQMGLSQALRACAPGRAIRRFAVDSIADNHWVVPPDVVSGDYPLEIDTFCPSTRREVLGEFEATVNGVVGPFLCLRPHEIELQQVPPDVLNTSNAQLQWHTQFLPPATEDQDADVPQGSLWSELVRSVRFYTHNERRPLRVRRFATHSKANIRFKGGGEAQVISSFEEQGQPAALGFEHEVDAVAFSCRFSPELLAEVRERSGATLRTAFLRDQIESDPQLLAVANFFRLGWMAQVFTSIILARALVQGCTLEESVAWYENHDWMPSVERVLNVIFGVLAVASEDGELGDEEEEEATPHNGASPKPRLYTALRDLALLSEVRVRLLELAHCLWEDPDENWNEWLRNRLKATLGGALVQACYAATPNVGNNDLLLDLESGVPASFAPHPCEEGEEVVWISEDVMGGAGVIEALQREYISDSRRFFLLVEAALAPSDFEVVDAQLTRVVALTQNEGDVQNSFEAVRTAESNQTLAQARRDLMETLRGHHVVVTHPVMTSLAARLVRPGSSPDTDELLAELIERWDAEEGNLGIEIDARIFAYLAAVDPTFKTKLDSILAGISGGSGDEDLQKRYSVLYGLLWPRGAVLRERALDSYNPYANAPHGDASLLREALQCRKAPVSIHDPDWRAQAQDLLRVRGEVLLWADSDSAELLQTAIREFLVVPVEAGFLRLYPHLSRLQNTLDGFLATLHLPEAIQ